MSQTDAARRTVDAPRSALHDGAMANTAGLSERQRKAIDRATATKNALYAAHERLQRALGLPQVGREERWAERVAQELEAARQALEEHKREVRGPGGLYDELRFEAPWLIPRVEQLTAQMDRIERELADLAVEVRHVADGDLRGVHHLRHDTERALAAVRDLLAREADLVYERFDEPAALD